MTNLCIFYGKDADPWCQYFKNYLSKEEFKINIIAISDEELPSLVVNTQRRTELSNCKVVITIASPGHLHTLSETPMFTYHGLVSDTSRALLFLCGSDPTDFIELKDINRRSVVDRFPNFDTWTRFTASEYKELLERSLRLVEMTRRKKIQFQMLPTEASCEAPTVMLLSFESEVTVQMGVEVVLHGDDSTDKPIKITATWLNPYTFTFTTPERQSPGLFSVSVFIDEKLMGSKSLKYLSPVSETMLGVSQLYLLQINQLCETLSQQNLLTSNVDSQISSIFKHDSDLDVPVQAFEQFFGLYRHFDNERSSHLEMPTLLHIAAKYGLKELSSCLVDLPDARLACSVANTNNQIPEEIASANKYDQLATLFKNFREIGESLENVYHRYINTGSQIGKDGYIITNPARRQKDSHVSCYYYLKADPENGLSDGSSDSDDLYEDAHQPILKRDSAFKVPATVSQISPFATLPRKPPPSNKPDLPALQPRIGKAPSNASSSGPAKQPVTQMSSSQQKLIDIMEQVKSKDLSPSDAEILFKEWQLRYKGGTTAISFKQKQEQLAKIREEIVAIERSMAPLARLTEAWSGGKPEKKTSVDNCPTIVKAFKGLKQITNAGPKPPVKSKHSGDSTTQNGHQMAAPSSSNDSTTTQSSIDEEDLTRNRAIVPRQKKKSVNEKKLEFMLSSKDALPPPEVPPRTGATRKGVIRSIPIKSDPLPDLPADEPQYLEVVDDPIPTKRAIRPKQPSLTSDLVYEDPDAQQPNMKITPPGTYQPTPLYPPIKTPPGVVPKRKPENR